MASKKMQKKMLARKKSIGEIKLVEEEEEVEVVEVEGEVEVEVEKKGKAFAT